MVAIGTNVAYPLETVPLVRTLRHKVHPSLYRWLDRAAIAVNRVWTCAQSTSDKAARPCTGRPKWLTGYDLCKRSAGACHEFECIGAATIQRVNCECGNESSPRQSPPNSTTRRCEARTATDGVAA
jgi:hypothetical protein